MARSHVRRALVTLRSTLGASNFCTSSALIAALARLASVAAVDPAPQDSTARAAEDLPRRWR
jgi:hypothetical protein